MNAQSQFEEVLKLIRETGDRCIVFRDGYDPVAVMDLASYKALLQEASKKQDISRLSEDQLLDKINRDIGEWRSSQGLQMQDYDLSQFRVDSKPGIAPVESIPSRPVVGKSPQEFVSNGVDLPVAPESDTDEYRLEPLM